MNRRLEIKNFSEGFYMHCLVSSTLLLFFLYFCRRRRFVKNYKFSLSFVLQNPAKLQQKLRIKWISHLTVEF